MELVDGSLQLTPFLTVTIGILVLFVGRRLNNLIPALREISIPEPVTGGVLFSILFTIYYLLTSVKIEFNLQARDLFLVYFFTTIGINASFKDLLKGGRPLVIL